MIGNPLTVRPDWRVAGYDTAIEFSCSSAARGLVTSLTAAVEEAFKHENIGDRDAGVDRRQPGLGALVLDPRQGHHRAHHQSAHRAHLAVARAVSTLDG